ncbi:6-phosphofructokinase [Mangrovactinospora gilvigrisea]|uniref:6-phosphofructokinase n=1 Tax=Mangrovactinospora gilvigrisea TaxID=1428644 RepID=A0A1J7C9D7_9ACTN|nr:6-phosphofructokinase [Mangrovactinospora gilvigrisea]OIV36250.1 6-phosphofructokinase [Mangrovactinospora gilvigrisea]
MRVGVLTGGGDCPGLNAVIRGIVRKGVQDYGYEFVGYRDGWRGPLEGDTTVLDIPAVRGILPRGGTILGTSRVNPAQIEGGLERIKRNLAHHMVDALICIGGEYTLGIAQRLSEEGVNIVGVPKTTDNDLNGTDFTFGFDTAVGVATEAIDRLHTTAESHHRVQVLEVMGRHAGWIAVHAGLAGGANVILIPEQKFDVEQVCRYVERRFAVNYSPIVVIADGALPVEGQLPEEDGTRDFFGRTGSYSIGEWLGKEIESRTGKETRTTVLGHTQRGGSPSAFDRYLATRFGINAVEAVHAGEWGTMVSMRAEEILRVPLAEATKEIKTVPLELYREVGVFFG